MKPLLRGSLLCLAIPAALLSAAAPPAGPSGAEVARLIGQLEDDDFDTREAATARLKLAGEPALDALHKALSSGDLEVRRRSRRIVTSVEARLYGPELLLAGHTDPVRCVCVSADGKRLLTGSRDGTLRLWDTDTGKCLRIFKGHTEGVGGAALSPDGKRVLSGGYKTVRLWDATTGKELYQMTGHTAGVRSVAFGPQGKALSGGFDGALRLWDLNTGKNAGTFTGHAEVVWRVAYSDRAKLAASCGYDDRSIRLWNLETGKEVRRIDAEDGTAVSDVCFSPDGKRLLSAGLFGSLHVWDVATGRELKRLAQESAYCAAFSPDGKRIISGSFLDDAVRVWDAETGKELRRYEGHTGWVAGVTFFPDGRRIASAGYDGTARVWRAPR